MGSISLNNQLGAVKPQQRYGVYCNTPAPFSLLWKIREGARVKKDQLLAVVTPADANFSFEIIPERVISHVEGRLVNRQYTSGLIRECSETEIDESTKTNGNTFLGYIIEEVCPHSVLVEGLCVDCGTSVSNVQHADFGSSGHAKNVTGVALNGMHKYTNGVSPATALTVNTMPHSTTYTSRLGFLETSTGLSVSHEAVQRLELEKISSLLKCKKLPLVLDLDNTLLHACPLRPPPDTRALLNEESFKVCTLNSEELFVRLRISANQKKDPRYCKAPFEYQRMFLSRFSPKNEEASFNNLQNDDTEEALIFPHYLDDEASSHEVKEILQRWESWVISLASIDSGCMTYGEQISGNRPTFSGYPRQYVCYYKLRPGVLTFLREASKLFELYLFTAGTSVHAASSLQVLDPARIWFGNRVFTREDLPQLECGALGLKTIQRIFPGDFTRHSLVTIVDDCEAVWTQDSNIFKVHAYHWWPDPSLHPFLLLYCRRTTNGVGSHSQVAVRVLDPEALTRIRAASSAVLNFCPSVIQLCRSPRTFTSSRPLGIQSIIYPTSTLDGGHSITSSSTSNTVATIQPKGFIPADELLVSTSSIISGKSIYDEAPDTKCGESNDGTDSMSKFDTVVGDAQRLSYYHEENQLLFPISNDLNLLTNNDQIHNAPSDANNNIHELLHQQKGYSLQVASSSLSNSLITLTDNNDNSNNNNTSNGNHIIPSPLISLALIEENATGHQKDEGEEKEDVHDEITMHPVKRRKIISTNDPTKVLLNSEQQDAALSRHTKGFDLRRQNETTEEMNARVLESATEGWTPPKVIKDTDRQLPYLLAALQAMHSKFFKQLGKISYNPTNTEMIDPSKLPSVRKILGQMRENVLKGVIMKSTGIREASIPDFNLTDLGRAVKLFGGDLVPQNYERNDVTHLLVGKETEFYMEAKRQKNFPFMPHLMWLEAAMFTFRRPNETAFPPDKCENDYRVFWDAIECDDSIEPALSCFETDDDEESSLKEHESDHSSSSEDDAFDLLEEGLLSEVREGKG